MIQANVYPPTELATKRLVLRLPTAADIEPTVELFDDDLSRWWLSAPQPYTFEHAEDWCLRGAHFARETGDGINWTIAEAETGAYVGGIGLARTHWQRRTAEVGYGVLAQARGHGYAAEALRAVAEWALQPRGLFRVELYAAVNNVRSQRVAEKAGFVREGVARNAGFTHHGQEDLVQYSMIPADLG